MRSHRKPSHRTAHDDSPGQGSDGPHPHGREGYRPTHAGYGDDYGPAAFGGDEARDRFGGTNWGAAFCGWLVAVAMAVLLTSIVGAVVTAVGSSVRISQSEAERAAGTIGLVAAAVLVTVLLLAYYTGGYVAGRMSRFDGARQGLAVWFIGLLVTLVTVGLGVLFGAEYNILDRVSLPRVPIPTEQLGWGGLITAAALVVGTALAAVAGGKVGHRYHDKVDRAAFG